MKAKVIKQHPELAGILDKGDIVPFEIVRDRQENYDHYQVQAKDRNAYTEDDLCQRIGNFTVTELFETL